MNYIYDCETFPNCFQLCAHCVETGERVSFEISDRQNDFEKLKDFVLDLKTRGHKMVGFNNVSFDYPVLHYLLVSGNDNAASIYNKAISIIESDDRFGTSVKPSDCWAEQIDLFKIHHFDNKARSTSLKALEFNMRMDNISDLPFPVGKHLTSPQMITLMEYCWNDVDATLKFYQVSVEQIAFRQQLTKKHSFSFMNFSDVKIGKEIFRITLEKAGVSCYNYDPEYGRTPKQTVRDTIRLADCVPKYVKFAGPEFSAILDFFNRTTIRETKGVFDDLATTYKGIEYKFGTGGLHASVENERYVANDEYMILDIDVTSLYPSIAIENNYYPEHLGEKFVEVYRNLREQRVNYAKGTPENAMLKLALNGVYGASNDQFSVFYDPLFTMKITIGGQLMIAMLAEQLSSILNVRIIQVNTDGITLHLPRRMKWLVEGVNHWWEELTGLHLESVEYKKMFIADVNSYAAQKLNGEIKRKGRYEYNTEWHQNASALVVPKVAEKVLFEDASMRETLTNWVDKMDFMLRVKVPRTSRLVVTRDEREKQLENTQRYYMSKAGGYLTKIMPPLAKKPDVYRRIAVQSGYNVQPCNNIAHATAAIDHDWYMKEIEKLTLGVM